MAEKNGESTAEAPTAEDEQDDALKAPADGAESTGTPSADQTAPPAVEGTEDTTAPAEEKTEEPKELSKSEELARFLAGESDEKADATTVAGTDEPKAKAAEQAKGVKPDAKADPASAKGAAKSDAPAKSAPIDDDAKPLPKDPKAASQAFAELRTTTKALKAQVAEFETWKPVLAKAQELGRKPEQMLGLAELGDEWARNMREHQAVADLGDCEWPQVAGVIRIQGALNRLGDGKATDADRATVQSALERLSEHAQAAGIQMPTHVQPYDGELPKSAEELVELGVPEARVRLLIALEAAEKRTAKAAGTKPAAGAPARSAASAAPRQPAEPARATVAAPAAATADDALYAGMTRSALTEAGIQAADHSTYFVEKVLPVIVSIVRPAIGPGKDPLQAFEAASPAVRHDLVKRALSRIDQQNPRTTAPPRSAAPVRRREPLTQRDTARVGRALTLPNSAAPGDAMSAFLAGERS